MEDRRSLPLILVVETSKRWVRHGAPTMSAAMAFYALTSLAPVLVIALSVADRLIDRELVREHLMDAVTALADPRASQLVGEVIAQPWFSGSSRVGSVLALLVLVFSATAGFSHLRDSLNVVWEVAATERSHLRAAVRGRLLAFGLAVAIGLLIVLSLLVRTAVAAFGSRVEGWLPLGTLAFRGGDLLLFVIGFTVLFAVILRYLPDIRTAWRHVLVGAFLTSVLVLLGEFAISFYLARVGTASAFGAVGSVVVLALWVHYSCMVFLWGAEFTAVYAGVRARVELDSIATD